MRDWLKKMRNEKSFTMKDIAEHIGISESYFCAIENGTRQKSLDVTMAERLSQAFCVPVSVIIDAEIEFLKSAKS